MGMKKSIGILVLVMASACLAEPIKSSVGARNTVGIPHSLLPYDAEVEYLASSGGGEYIDTGVYHYKTNDIYIKVYTFAQRINRHSERFYLATNGVYQSKFQRYAQAGNFFYVGNLLYGQIPCRNLPTNVTYEVHVHAEDTGNRPGNEYATINGIQYSNDYSWNTPQVSASTVILFPNVNTGNRIYYFRIDNQISLKPVRKGNVGYMYDEMTGMLYGNCAGKGGFIIGPDVPEP